MFVVFLRFSESLAIKFLSLNDENMHVRSTLIDLNPDEQDYPFMISLDKCTGGCNLLSPKICVLRETKNTNVKAFNLTREKNEAMTKLISCDFKRKFSGTTCSPNQNWNSKTCWCECKNYRKCKKIIVGTLAQIFVRISSNYKVLLIL